MKRWQDSAACDVADPRLFDPMTPREAQLAGNHPDRCLRVRAALDYCRDCPVWKECTLDGADNRLVLVLGTYGGTYVGTDEAKRRRSWATKRARRRLGVSPQARIAHQADTAARNVAIAEKVESGWTMTRTAEHYGISVSRVSRIVRELAE